MYPMYGSLKVTHCRNIFNWSLIELVKADNIDLKAGIIVSDLMLAPLCKNIF